MSQTVNAYQQTFGLPQTGVVDRATWRSIYDTYESILQTVELIDGGVELYPGEFLRMGSQGEDVATIQEYLVYLSETYPQIPAPSVTGIYGQETAMAVMAFQQLFNLEQSGEVGPLTWDAIASTYAYLRFGNAKRPGQYPGFTLSQEGEQ